MIGDLADPGAPRVEIWHNPACGTSRNVLALIRHVGIEPIVIEYLREPPDIARLREAIADAGLGVRGAIRSKQPEYRALGLDDQTLPDEALLAAMVSTPVLINRPFVFTPLGVRLCRPESAAVLDLLPPCERPFAKEDGEVVIDAMGRRVR